MRPLLRELSADTKKKLSEAQKRRWAQRKAERSIVAVGQGGANAYREQSLRRQREFYRVPIISADLRASLVMRQNGACAICGDTSDELVLDHSHETGRIRGLLCSRCNISLAWFRDDPKRLRRAATYLEGTI